MLKRIAKSLYVAGMGQEAAAFQQNVRAYNELGMSEAAMQAQSAADQVALDHHAPHRQHLDLVPANQFTIGEVGIAVSFLLIEWQHAFHTALTLLDE